MTHYEIDELEPSPEEEELQNVKKQEVENKEKEIVAKEITKEAKIDKALESATEQEEQKEQPETYNYKEQKQITHNQSLFYPLAQALDDYLANKLGIEPANESEREAIKNATMELEQKYGADKIDSPEARFVVAEVTPFIRQFDKVLMYIKGEKFTIQPENKPIKHEETAPPEANIPAGFKFNQVQSKQ